MKHLGSPGTFLMHLMKRSKLLLLNITVITKKFPSFLFKKIYLRGFPLSRDTNETKIAYHVPLCQFTKHIRPMPDRTLGNARKLRDCAVAIVLQTEEPGHSPL